MKVSRVMVAMSVLLFAQGSYAWRKHAQPMVPHGPVTGRAIPDVVIQTVGKEKERHSLREILTRPQGCTVVVAMSVYCGWCQRMRPTWSDSFRQLVSETGPSVVALWIFANEKDEVEDFLRGFALDSSIAVATVASDPDESFRRLGVLATPTTYVADRFGNLRFGIEGSLLPEARQVDSLCR